MTQAPWWTDAVGYEVYIRSFADSDGDGVGDLRGLRDRLDHLAWLGVDIVWVTPFYPSPMHDHGYDVADYTGVHEQFGTPADLDALVARAHELDLRVIIDLVPNHSSSEHEWFRAARSSKDSPYRDYYIWRDGRVAGPPEDGGEPPNNWVSVFGGRAWSYDHGSDQWWLHLFLPEQPDLNWANPAVRDEFDRILRFWLERGVDGFRIDVAHALAKHPDLPDIPATQRAEDPHDIGDAVSQSDWEQFDHPFDIDQEDVTGIYRRWRRVAEPFEGLLLGEVYLQDPVKLARYLNPQDGLHLSFWFKPLHVRWSPEAIREVIRSAVREIPDHLAWVQGSHDRTRAATRFGGGDAGRARSLALGTLYMGLPGIPFLYMGEELGLEDVPVPPERSQDPIAVRHDAPERARDNCRTPMPWEPSPGLGFTTAEDAWLPFGDRRPQDTVAVQREDPASWLSRWRRLIEARRACDLTGDVEWMGEDGDVVAYRRGGTVVAANCGDGPGSIELPDAGDGGWVWGFDSLGDGHEAQSKDTVGGVVDLAPLQAVILHRR